MDRNQILAAARQEKNRGKELDNKEAVRGDLLAGIIAITMMILMGFFEFFVQGTINFGYLAVLMAMGTAQALYQGIKNKKAYLIVVGVVDGLLAIMAVLLYIWQVMMA